MTSSYRSAWLPRVVELPALPAWLPLALEARDMAASCAGDPGAYAGAYRAVLLRLARVIQDQLAHLPEPAPPPDRPAGALHTGPGY